MGTNITGIGNANAIGFKSRVTGGIYFPPELKDALVGVWSAYGKSNDSTDRNIIKNKIKDRGGDFVISNAAFKLNSGFGKYEVDFTTWSKVAGTSIITDSKYVLTDEKAITNGGYFLWNRLAKDSFKVKISNIPNGGWMSYRYRITEEDTKISSLFIREDGIYTLPATVAGSDVDFFISTVSAPAKDWVGLTITQIPSFEGAFVTDGINDMITSTKTVQEMLGGSNEIAVVSMMANLDSRQILCNSNYNNTNGYNVRNTLEPNGVISMLGYTDKNGTTNNLNLIMGDKDSIKLVDKVNFNSDYVFFPAQYYGSYYKAAWYWTVIANKVLTTDEINQVIAYFNLDRTLRPDILCNITKQGITNDNHADFNDKLIDYSGNGRDIQMNNLAWKGGSGIAAKKFETIKDYNIVPDEGLQELTIYNEFSFKIKSIRYAGRYWAVQSLNKTDMSYPVTIITDKDIIWRNALNYTDADGVKGNVKKETNVPANTPTQVFIYGFNDFDISDDYTKVNCVAYATRKDITEFTVTFIPSYKGGLLLDGVNDFGKVTGMPVYKDYTVVADYERFYLEPITGGRASILSKSSKVGDGSFIFNLEDQNGGKACYTFGEANGNISNDITRIIRYQSKYYNTKALSIGTAEDNDFMVLGKVREVDNRYFYGAIYSLMTFPYSMSEFLIERQLKKHKLGTLYPDMVEFRPIVTYDKDLISKLKYFYIHKYANWVSISPGDYLPNNAEISFTVDLRYPVDEVSSNLVFSNLENVRVVKSSGSGNSFDIRAYVTNKSPQKINITIDEYIRYEDIVQPYPVLLRFKDENGNEVSWGGKFKVGSNITRIGSIADPESNLLNGLYSISGLSLNGKGVTSSTSIVEKQMVFKTIATYLLDNNEPKCILSPRLLRIPNSSYKILGHIPDISGHGNHGKINNSAYKLNSGVNGYLVDFTTLKDDGIKGIVRTDSKIYLDKSFNYNQGFWLGRTNNPSPAYKVKVSGIPETGMLTYTGGVWLNLVNGINELPARTNTEEEHGFVIQSPNLDWSNLVIEQIGEYEGAYCLDGVDDFVTIPTLSSGGKQVLMKVNWHGVDDEVLYDQRNSNIQGNYDLAISTYPDTIAYNFRNEGGKTFIDGILNSHIITNNLKNITHNISSINGYNNDNNSTICIGKSVFNGAFAQMALYDFMLFDNISTDDKIKELNEYVGIEAKVELPPYYYDTYGKTNLDADKTTIQQRGVAVGDYDLINYNHAYEGMSGYNGYPIILSGTNRTYQDKTSYVNVVGDDKNVINLTRISFNTAAIFSYVKQNGELTSYNKYIESFKIKVTGIDYSRFVIKYNYISEANAIAKTTMTITSDGIYELPKSFASDGSLTSSDVWIGINFTKQSNDMPDIIEDVNVTIKVLPEYENGLAYDGVENFSDNKNIPIFTDFTAIIKRIDLDAKNNNSAVMFKGNKIYESSIGNGFILDYHYNSKNYVCSYSKINQIERDDSKIIYLTPESYNGNPIIKGENGDNLGLILGKYWKGIIYKTILYSKTISLLEINFLKNLMEKDEIIDLTNPIFIKNE